MLHNLLRFKHVVLSLHFAICGGVLLAQAISDQDPANPNKAVDHLRSTEGKDAKEVKLDVHDKISLSELKHSGVSRSRFAIGHDESVKSSIVNLENANQSKEARLVRFETKIKPLLLKHCVDCHGPELIEGQVRIDTLDPDLASGADVDWWMEVFSVVTKGEMPPAEEGALSSEVQSELVDWLTAELHLASLLRRQNQGLSSFRRLTRYEYNYALQDLLGLPWDFADDLPPEAHAEDGFVNRSDLLHISVDQFETYQQIARESLRRAIVVGPRPKTMHWLIPIDLMAEREWSKQEQQIEKLKNDLKEDPDKLSAEVTALKDRFLQRPGGAHYQDLEVGRFARTQWQYYNAKYAFAPTDDRQENPPQQKSVALLPNGESHRIIFELGNHLPDEGTMRVTAEVARSADSDHAIPSLQLLFGWQASNEGRALLRVSSEDTAVTGSIENPQVVQWDVPLGEIYPRNSVRKTSPMGSTPSPSEYVRIVNSSASKSLVRVNYLRVEAPVFNQWPPESHRKIFSPGEGVEEESERARLIIGHFMNRAWRRNIASSEIDAKLKQFLAIRSRCDSFEEAIAEVLSVVLSSPQFLYVSVQPEIALDGDAENTKSLDGNKLAERLALFLWCSVPDQELTEIASEGRLTHLEVLESQVERMLDDPRCERFVEQFVWQWLDLQLLEFQNFKQNVGGFDPLLKEAMLQEPIAFFSELLSENLPLLDLVHCDYAMLNERLATHYGVAGVQGNHFRKVTITDDARRGGLLTQAGFLAMNSDWPDSHPLKRAIWLLESVLDDPPPPPPPAVPQIDLADPEIAKMTLKERIEDHRNHAACLSCHAKIDPWGIAFENYDALGRWRNSINGQPIDASSKLFNGEVIDGVEGLKRFLLINRQDQVVQATVSKLLAYSLGRPLTFADRSEVDRITAQVRRSGDGLREVIHFIVQSDLFRTW